MRWTILLSLFCTTFAAQEPRTESLSIVPDRSVLRFGEPFTLIVTRTWEEGAPMEPLTPSMLEPLDLRLVASMRTAQGRWVRDVQTYRGHIFQTGRVVLPRIVLRVHENASGIMREVASPAWTFEVTSGLDGKNPFVPESPPRESLLRLATPAPRVVWILLVGSALIGGLIWGAWRAGRNGAARRSPVAVSPSERLERLFAAWPETERRGRSRVVDEVVACLRAETARRTGTAIESLTDAELEGDPDIQNGLGADEFAELVGLLRRGSEWRYRECAPDREDLERFAAAARDWVDCKGPHDSREGVIS